MWSTSRYQAAATHANRWRTCYKCQRLRCGHKSAISAALQPQRSVPALRRNCQWCSAIIHISSGHFGKVRGGFFKMPRISPVRPSSAASLAISLFSNTASPPPARFRPLDTQTQRSAFIQNLKLVGNLHHASALVNDLLDCLKLKSGCVAGAPHNLFSFSISTLSGCLSKRVRSILCRLLNGFPRGLLGAKQVGRSFALSDGINLMGYFFASFLALSLACASGKSGNPFSPYGGVCR